MRTFRGKKVRGWEIVEDTERSMFQQKVNHFMDRYEFMDYQYSICTVKDGCREKVMHSAAILLADKEESE